MHFASPTPEDPDAMACGSDPSPRILALPYGAGARKRTWQQHAAWEGPYNTSGSTLPVRGSAALPADIRWCNSSSLNMQGLEHTSAYFSTEEAARLQCLAAVVQAVEGGALHETCRRAVAVQLGQRGGARRQALQQQDRLPDSHSPSINTRRCSLSNDHCKTGMQQRGMRGRCGLDPFEHRATGDVNHRHRTWL